MNDIREALLEHDEQDATGLPGGVFGQLVPFLLLAAGAIWLFVNWDSIPQRVPMHWNAHGHVDSYVAKSRLRVGMPLVIAACICLLLHFMARMIRDSSPRGAARKPSLRLMLISEIFIAGICCAAEMISASNGRLFLPGIIFILVLAVTLIGICVGMTAGMPKTVPRNPAGYHHGLYYSDAEDPALFVPKSTGLGYTINFGHPAGKPLMVLILLLPLATGLVAILMR
jgi:uncharacterized membrane protein